MNSADCRSVDEVSRSFGEDPNRLSLFTDMFAARFCFSARFLMKLSNESVVVELKNSTVVQACHHVVIHFSYPFTIFRDAAFGSEKIKPPWLQWICLQPEQDDATLESTLEIDRRDEFPIFVPGNYHRYGVPTRGDLGVSNDSCCG